MTFAPPPENHHRRHMFSVPNPNITLNSTPNNNSSVINNPILTLILINLNLNLTLTLIISTLTQ